jgi:alpha-mannosidase
MLSVQPENLMISTFKMAEDRSGDSILRVYETHGEPSAAVVAFPCAAKVWETDMLEKNGTPLVEKGRELHVAFRPHEIKTFRIRFDPSASPRFWDRGLANSRR